MIDPQKVSGVLVTRGNRDVGRIVDTMAGLGEVVVWDNSRALIDRKVFGRFLAAKQAKHEVIFTVDDDAIVDVLGIVACYEPGKLVCNMKPGHHDYYRGTGLALLGHGSVFDRSLVDFGPYVKRFAIDELFDRECDRVFTFLNRDRQKWLALPIEDLPHASEPGAMWKDPRHGRDLVEIRRRLAAMASGVFHPTVAL